MMIGNPVAIQPSNEPMAAPAAAGFDDDGGVAHVGGGELLKIAHPPRDDTSDTYDTYDTFARM